jgi:hypothetical protein
MLVDFSLRGLVCVTDFPVLHPVMPYSNGNAPRQTITPNMVWVLPLFPYVFVILFLFFDVYLFTLIFLVSGDSHGGFCAVVRVSKMRAKSFVVVEAPLAVARGESRRIPRTPRLPEAL